MEHLQGMYKSNPTALLNGKSFVCLRDIYQIFLAHLRILKNLMKKNYLLKTKTYFLYYLYFYINPK